MTTTSAVRTPALVEGAKAGDPNAWNRIVTEYGPRIRGYARARGAPDPDDVTQDVFVAAASRIGDFDGDDDALRSWLFGIAYRQIVDRYRAKAKQTAPLPATLPDAGPSPEGAVVGAAEAGAAVAALDVLTDLERDVVLMRVVGEMHSRDVAAAVGKAPGNVRVIQSRAMAKLRRELRRRGYGPAAVWAGALVADVVAPVAQAHATAVAGAAASTVGPAATGAAVAGAAGIPAAVKVVTAVALAAAVGGGAAVTGTLPDEAQRRVADLADRVGLTLPRPAVPATLDGAETVLTDVTLPDATTLPDTTLLPDTTVPPDTTLLLDAVDLPAPDAVLDGDTALPDATALPGGADLPEPDIVVEDTVEVLQEEPEATLGDTADLPDPFRRLLDEADMPAVEDSQPLP